MPDIFISYTKSDREWAFWIAKELEALDHKPHVHEWEIEAGAAIYAWMEEHHDAADHVLCVVSDEYLKAPFSTLERQAALWQSAHKKPGFALLVVVKPCTLPTLSDHLRRCDLVGLSDDKARATFRQFIADPTSPKFAPYPGTPVAVSNIAVRSPTYFMGRDQSLVQLQATLSQSAPSGTIAVLHGMRGVGKTTLAATFAGRNRDRYRCTWWIRAQSEAGIREDLSNLGRRLGWVDAEANDDTALSSVQERLRHEGPGFLLIFDNALHVEVVKRYLPLSDGCHVIITSTSPTWRSVGEPIEVGLWPGEVGADYLIARTNRGEERESAHALSKSLGGLPLAHEQAAAYCEHLSVSFREYAARFESAPVSLLDTERYAPGEYNGGLTVAKTFALAMDEAAKQQKGTARLVAYCGQLAPEPIPLFLFSEAANQTHSPFEQRLATHELEAAVAALRDFAIINRIVVVDERNPSITTDCIQMHRLVREVAAACVDEVQLKSLQRELLDALLIVYPRDGYDNPISWPRCSCLTPHLLHLRHTAIDCLPTMPWSSLLDRVVGYFHGKASYDQAIALMQDVLQQTETTLGSKHPETATALNSLALLLKDKGDIREAKSLLERSLSIREEALDADDPNVASSQESLGSLLTNLGDFGRARPLLERALEIREEAFGPEHPETARILNNLAFLLGKQGDDERAIVMYERALAISEKEQKDIPIAAILNNLGELLIAKDRKRAKHYLERAMTMNERLLGALHPDVAMSHNNLGLLLQWEGNLTEARDHYEKALQIIELRMGPDHLRVGTALANLSHIMWKQGDRRWRSHSRRALAIYQKAQDPDLRYVRLGYWGQEVFWYLGPWLKLGFWLFIGWLLWRTGNWLFGWLM